MSELTARQPSWMDYLPGNVQQAWNTSPVINALTRMLNKPTPDIEGAARRQYGPQDALGSIADKEWLERQAAGPSWFERNPSAADGVNKLGLLANFLGPGVKLPAAAPKPTGIRAYHSSPYDFDRFDSSKLGTGEGGQWFGYGHYLAGSPETREIYQRTLARPYVFAKDEPLPSPPKLASRPGAEDPKSIGNASRLAELDEYIKGSSGKYDAMIAKLESLGLNRNEAVDVSEFLYGSSLPKAIEGARDIDPRSADIMQRLLDEGSLRPASGRNRRYDVLIHSSPDRLGFLDKPISQQPEAVQNALSKVLPRSELGLPSLWDRLRGVAPTDPRLMDVVKAQLEKKASKALSDGLRERGVDGFTYRNGMTRGRFGEVAPESHNYVVFDDKLIEILRKYGLLPPAAVGAAGLANQQQEPPL